MPLHVIDTAGLRDSDDLIEQEGIRRAWNEIESADRVLMMVDDREGITVEDHALRERLPPGVEVTVVRNKIDLTQHRPEFRQGLWGTEILLSAKTGVGLELLSQHLKDCMGYRSTGEGEFMARRRHLEALKQASAALDRAWHQLKVMQAGELVAEELRLAQESLGEITGEFSSDDLLGRIFSSFCIGK